MGNGTSTSHTKILLDYIENGKKDDIIKLSIELKDQFIDDEFDIYEQKDLYVDNEVQWLRPYEFGQDYLFTKDNNDVIADNIIGYIPEIKGFITAISSLCSRVDYLKSIFVLYNVNAGCACIELCLNSEKKLVIIDDRIPCVIVDGIIHPLYANYHGGGCWILLLVKAFAKLYGGYSNAFPSLSHSMVAGAKEYLRDLTGEHCISYLTKESLHTYIKYELPKDYTVTKQFEKALNWSYYSQGKCFNAFLTHFQFHMAVLSCSSLLKVEDTIDIQDFAIVNIEQDNYLHDIPDITADVDLLISVRDCPIDGTYGTKTVTTWKDFVFNFDYVNAALLGHSKDWNVFSYISDEWIGDSAGGGIFTSTWRDNPMFRITVPKPRPLNGKLLVTLSLPDGRVNRIQTYPRIALTICLDDPALNDCIAHTAYEPRRDSTIEIDLLEDVWVYDIIPSTYEVGIESAFYITATLLHDGYERSPVEIEKIVNWKGFENIETFYGSWIENVNAFGRLGTLRENVFCNPCWKMSVPFPRDVDTIDFKICILLATEKKKKESKVIKKEYSLSLFDDNDYLYSGTYLLTPNSLKQMKQQNPDFEKGVMGRFGFARSPYTNRKEMFQLSVESRTERIDRSNGIAYKDIIIMPTTFREDEEGSFKITVMTSIPTIISRMTQDIPYDTDGLNQKYQKKKIKSLNIDRNAFKNQMHIMGSGTRSILLDTVKTSYEKPKDPKQILEKSQRIKIWEDDDDEEEEDILARHPLKQFKPKTSDVYKEKFEQQWKEYWHKK